MCVRERVCVWERERGVKKFSCDQSSLSYNRHHKSQRTAVKKEASLLNGFLEKKISLVQQFLCFSIFYWTFKFISEPVSGLMTNPEMPFFILRGQMVKIESISSHLNVFGWLGYLNRFPRQVPGFASFFTMKLQWELSQRIKNRLNVHYSTSK